MIISRDICTYFLKGSNRDFNPLCVVLALTKILANDTWKVSGQLIMCVWDINQKESAPPIGFISFDISRLETRTKRVGDLFLTVNIIWVHPSKCSLWGNTARHIVSHLLAYLGDCNFTKTIVGLSVMNVYYHANLNSSGRGKRVLLLSSFLNPQNLILLATLEYFHWGWF